MVKYIKEASRLLVVLSLVSLSTVFVHCLDSVYGVDRLYLIVASPAAIPTLQLENPIMKLSPSGVSRCKVDDIPNSAGHEDASTQKAANASDTGQAGSVTAKKAYGVST